MVYLKVYRGILQRRGICGTLTFGKELNAKLIKELPTHELLQKLGYIRQDHAGLVHWLPLGLRTLKNIESIINKRMEECGSLEVALSSMSGSELWKRTGRWGNEELFKIKDDDYCLVPTCEEEVTKVVNDSVSSYRDLPVIVHQITRKYRDEKRPRAGLLRGREFLMKDAYSFDVDETHGMATFEKLNETYRKIFSDLRVPFVAANADSGDIGGDLSTEWHYQHPSGEDVLFTCDSCGTVSNSEKATSFPVDDEVAPRAKAAYFTTLSRDKLVVMYYPENRILNPQLAKTEVPDLDLSVKDEQTVLDLFLKDTDDAFLSKWTVRIMDPRVNKATDLPDLKVPYHRNSMSTFMDVPLIEAKAGEICAHCEEGKLVESKAIEVGHTFYLDDKYSAALKAGFVDTNGKFQHFKMGCYGIGVSRLVAAIAEVLRDAEGLCWPAAVAPYHTSLICAPGADAGAVDAVRQQLGEVSVLEDKRPKISIGRQLKESKSLGIPLQIIVGKSYPNVEVEVRGKRFSDTSSAVYEEKHADWGWSRVEDGNYEKHVVSAENLSKVVNVLIEDL